MKKTILALALIPVLTLNSCARNISSNVYQASAVGETSFTYQGSILSVRTVTVKHSETLEGNTLGVGVGGAVGGIAGSHVGGGSGSAVGAIGGAVLGGLAGAMVEDKLKEQQAFEYVVKLTNGQVMTVVQGTDVALAVGQRVFVMVSHDGRSRITPDNSGTTDVQAPISTPTVRVNKNR